jgi:hypothetical protein
VLLDPLSLIGPQQPSLFGHLLQRQRQPGGAGAQLPVPGKRSRATAVCDPECPVCKRFTVAGATEELAARNLAYGPVGERPQDNRVDARLVVRGSNSVRMWVLVDSRGHEQPWYPAQPDRAIATREPQYVARDAATYATHKADHMA